MKNRFSLILQPHFIQQLPSLPELPQASPFRWGRGDLPKMKTNQVIPTMGPLLMLCALRIDIFCSSCLKNNSQLCHFSFRQSPLCYSPSQWSCFSFIMLVILWLFITYLSVCCLSLTFWPPRREFCLFCSLWFTHYTKKWWPSVYMLNDCIFLEKGLKHPFKPLSCAMRSAVC